MKFSLITSLLGASSALKLDTQLIQEAENL